MRITLCVAVFLIALMVSGEILTGETDPKIVTGILCVKKRRSIKRNTIYDSTSFIVCEPLSLKGKRLGGEFFASIEADSELGVEILKSIPDKMGTTRTWIIAQHIGTYKTTSGRLVPIYLIKKRYNQKEI